jgi:hypothetical protein
VPAIDVVRVNHSITFLRRRGELDTVLHYEPAALFVAEVERPHERGFASRLGACKGTSTRLRNSDARQERDAPPRGYALADFRILALGRDGMGNLD